MDFSGLRGGSQGVDSVAAAAPREPLAVVICLRIEKLKKFHST